MANATLGIHRFREEHRAALGAILPPGMLDAITVRLRNRDGVSTLFVDGRPVGVAILTLDGQVTVFVEEASRRRGIGTLAGRHVVGVASRARLRRLHCVVREGTAAAALARKLGFQEARRSGQRIELELRLA